MCYLQHESVRICNRADVVNRVKLREDTFPFFKTETIRSETGESKLTKKKQEPQKAHFTQFPAVSVANCLPITLRQTMPLLEADILPYPFYRTCFSIYLVFTHHFLFSFYFLFSSSNPCRTFMTWTDQCGLQSHADGDESL